MNVVSYFTVTMTNSLYSSKLEGRHAIQTKQGKIKPVLKVATQNT